MLYVKLFGAPSLAWYGKPFALPRRQARALLYRLAADVQPVSREQLIFLFWPDLPDARARKNLSRLASYLSNALPEDGLLQAGRDSIALDQARTSVDVQRFEQLIGEEDDGNLEEAVALYDGTFLSGFYLANTPEYENWSAPRAERLESILRSALARLVQRKEAVGDLAGAIGYGQRYLAHDDLAEEMHRRLINLHASAGDRAAAQRQYEQCVTVLERELGVDPLPETRAAFEAARDGYSTHAAKPPGPEWAVLPGLDLPLMGRDTSLQLLNEAYVRFSSGGVIFISGEPGVGKSRLMQEFASASSAWVLTGSNHIVETAVPYQPLIQALRQALVVPERWRHASPIWLSELSRLMPELPEHFAGLPPPLNVEPEHAQARIFESLRRVFVSLSGDEPLLLCLDDVHWADESTRAWLQYLSRSLGGSQVCLLATYRAHEQHILRGWQRELERADLMTVVELAGLPEEAVGDMLATFEIGPLGEESLAARIHAATGGNAFFVLETIREFLSMGQTGDSMTELPLPASVRDAILRRAGRLTPLARQILEVAAVVSPLATFPVIAQTAGRGERETATSLEELAASQLIASDGDRFRFQHDLAREAIYQAVSHWRRRLLHRRAAVVMTALPAGQEADLATIAAHFQAAGNRNAALDYLNRAATEATAIFAFREAANHLRRGITLVQDTDGAAAQLPQLYEDYAYNLKTAGEYAAAENAYREALALLPGGQPLRRAALERKLAATLTSQHREEEAEAIYRTALARVDRQPTEDANQRLALHLNILLSFMDTLFFQHRLEAMAELQAQVEALLEEVGTARQRMIYATRLGQLAVLETRFRLSAKHLALAQNMLAYAQEVGDIRMAARMQYYVGYSHWTRGEFAEGETALGRALASAEAYGDSWLQNQCLAHLNILFRMIGDVARVKDQLPQLIESSTMVNSDYYRGVPQANAAWLHYRDGELAPALSRADAAVTIWASVNFPFQWLARWIQLAIFLERQRMPDAIVAARVMLNVKQQKLPDEMEARLASAVNAWESNHAQGAGADLEAAVELAARDGYL